MKLISNLSDWRFVVGGESHVNEVGVEEDHFSGGQDEWDGDLEREFVQIVADEVVHLLLQRRVEQPDGFIFGKKFKEFFFLACWVTMLEHDINLLKKDLN